MATQFTKEQFLKLIKGLPIELQTTLFSGDTTNHIVEACKRNDVPEKAPLVSDEIRDVLMGVTLPKGFQEKLQKEVGLKAGAAQAVAQELNRLVFYPVKAQLEEIHRVPAQEQQQVQDIGVATPRHEKQAKKPAGRQAAPQAETAPEDDYMSITKKEEPEEVVEEPKPKQSDQYREAVE